MTSSTPDPNAAGPHNRPTPLISADPASFAWSVLHHRHPVLIEQVRAAHPYSPAQNQALDKLVLDATEGVVSPPDPGAHDASQWQRWTEPYVGQRWDEVPFLWAESYFYRRLLDAIDFFAPGPWHWVDPFAHQKNTELLNPALAAELADLDQLAELTPQERRDALLFSALWGNRADLSFAAHAASTGSPDVAVDEHLVVNNSDELWRILADGAATICIVADNAGRELLADLVLIDELLTSGTAAEVALHVKPTPYYVSDATAADVAACLHRLAAIGGQAAATAARLRDAFRVGQARLSTNWFYVAPLEFHVMPHELEAELAAATLTILKGDLNYRRVFGDRAWPLTTDASAAASYFPGPLAILRTLKSELAVGIPDNRLAELNGIHGWQTSGTHAMIQVVGTRATR